MEKDNKNEDFLQSEQWRKFQEAVGRKIHLIEREGFSASIVEHVLPIVGKYFYVPRGPILTNHKLQISNSRQNPNDKMQASKGMQELVELAKKENAGWVRIEPEDEKVLELMKENTEHRIFKAPHDMQPREVFVMDITKTAEQLLMEMKSKTRYNIGIAKKRGVIIVKSEKSKVESLKYAEEFLKLTKEMAERHGITAHPQQYYRKMIESMPEEMLKIYVAEFEGKIIAANLVLFFENTATYLHGASGNLHRNLMAPFLLQWQSILDAKEKGCTRYDFGGVNTKTSNNAWAGITTFKEGFSMKTKPVEFPGAYDIIVNSRKYAVYRGLQKAQAILHRIRK
ncbi:MAG: methicillin resistance protein [uncultured bacterium]|nr:MAG: methicillin resistance protein [uncultured bacterium]